MTEAQGTSLLTKIDDLAEIGKALGMALARLTVGVELVSLLLIAIIFLLIVKGVKS